MPFHNSAMPCNSTLLSITVPCLATIHSFHNCASCQPISSYSVPFQMHNLQFHQTNKATYTRSFHQSVTHTLTQHLMSLTVHAASCNVCMWQPLPCTFNTYSSYFSTSHILSTHMQVSIVHMPVCTLWHSLRSKSVTECTNDLNPLVCLYMFLYGLLFQIMYCHLWECECSIDWFVFLTSQFTGHVQWVFLLFSGNSNLLSLILCSVDSASLYNCVKKTQLDAAQLTVSVFHQSLHVLGISRPIIRRYNRIQSNQENSNLKD
jgi:hypothetical protein